MSDSESDREFRKLADSFIHLANKHCDATAHLQVNASLLFAASRFCAFVTAVNTDTREQLGAEKEEAIAYFVREFGRMLRENVEDYETHYQKYRG